MKQLVSGHLNGGIILRMKAAWVRWLVLVCNWHELTALRPPEGRLDSNNERLFCPVWFRAQF